MRLAEVKRELLECEDILLLYDIERGLRFIYNDITNDFESIVTQNRDKYFIRYWFDKKQALSNLKKIFSLMANL